MMLKNSLILAFIILSVSSCKKKVEEIIVYDNVVHGVNTQTIYANSAQKTRQKSPELIISIMYADIFSQGITSNTLLEIGEIYQATGDKTMFNELIFSHFLKDPAAVLPTDVDMRNDIDQFIIDSYINFFLREPNEYEKHYLKNLIENDASLTVENIYTSVVLSNEYFFY